MAPDVLEITDSIYLLLLSMWTQRFLKESAAGTLLVPAFYNYMLTLYETAIEKQKFCFTQRQISISDHSVQQRGFRQAFVSIYGGAI